MSSRYGFKRTASPVSVSGTASQPEDTLEDYFRRYTSFIRRNFGHIETQYARPTLSYTLTKFNKSPVFITWFVTSIFLNILPILSFIGASLFVLSTIMFAALVVAISFSFSIISFFVSILFIALGFQFSLAAAFTFSGVSAYLGGRLVLLIFSQPRDLAGLRTGLSLWWEEARTFVFPATAPEQVEDTSRSQTPQNRPVARGSFRQRHLRAVSFTAPRDDEDTSFDEGVSLERIEPEADTHWYHHEFGDRYNEYQASEDSIAFPRDDEAMGDPAGSEYIQSSEAVGW